MIYNQRHSFTTTIDPTFLLLLRQISDERKIPQARVLDILLYKALKDLGFDVKKPKRPAHYRSGAKSGNAWVKKPEPASEEFEIPADDTDSTDELKALQEEDELVRLARA